MALATAKAGSHRGVVRGAQGQAALEALPPHTFQFVQHRLPVLQRNRRAWA